MAERSIDLSCLF